MRLTPTEHGRQQRRLALRDFSQAKQYARLARIAGKQTRVRRSLNSCAAARLFLMAMPARQYAAWVRWAK